MYEQYVSGNWTVRPGSEEEFIARWLDFTTWSKENAAGARSFVLLRDDAEPRHFVSIGTFDDRATMEAWRDSAGFASRFQGCRELCEDFYGSDYQVVASPTLVG